MALTTKGKVAVVLGTLAAASIVVGVGIELHKSSGTSAGGAGPVSVTLGPAAKIAAPLGSTVTFYLPAGASWVSFNENGGNGLALSSPATPGSLSPAVGKLVTGGLWTATYTDQSGVQQNVDMIYTSNSLSLSAAYAANTGGPQNGSIAISPDPTSTTYSPGTKFTVSASGGAVLDPYGALTVTGGAVLDSPTANSGTYQGGDATVTAMYYLNQDDYHNSNNEQRQTFVLSQGNTAPVQYSLSEWLQGQQGAPQLSVGQSLQLLLDEGSSGQDDLYITVPDQNILSPTSLNAMQGDNVTFTAVGTGGTQINIVNGDKSFSLSVSVNVH